jgi:hypothetical protein
LQFCRRAASFIRLLGVDARRWIWRLERTVKADDDDTEMNLVQNAVKRRYN